MHVADVIQLTGPRSAGDRNRRNERLKRHTLPKKLESGGIVDKTRPLTSFHEEHSVRCVHQPVNVPNVMKWGLFNWDHLPEPHDLVWTIEQGR